VVQRPGEAGEPEELRRLMATYQAGDAAGFDQLYGALAPLLRRYLGRLARDPARVEDLLQEAFLQLHKARHTFDPAFPVSPWAFAIARHVFLADARRRRRARDVLPLPDETSRLAESDAGPSAAVAAHELDRALAELPAERRAPLVLHHLRGWSFDEIATRLGIREGTARVRAHRALDQLRQLLGGKKR
jgi:RNA polymerase sigma-70 factor (ECF subfamily)